MLFQQNQQLCGARLLSYDVNLMRSDGQVKRVELSPEFRRRVIAGYATDTKARLIMATLRETSEEGWDARMPYYIDNNLLYQRQNNSETKQRNNYARAR